MDRAEGFSETKPNSSPRRTRYRSWLLKSLAIATGLSLFVFAEILCWLFGFGDQLPTEDPFVGFSQLEPLFEINESGDQFSTTESRLKFFSREEFPAVKPPGTKRIFCLGGSTVQGRPFSKETSFTTWLELALNEAHPEQSWDVINCGGISYASYRLTPILKECFSYEPDVFIVCTGHNEFLEDRSYGSKNSVSPLITVPYHGLSRFRSFRLFRQLLTESSKQSADTGPMKGRELLGSDVDAFLDYRNGIAAYHRDDIWRQGVTAHFESNLDRMAKLAKDAGVPILFVLPPSNLADSPPFKSEHRNGITASELEQWNAAIASAKTYLKSFPAAAVEPFREAIRIDPEFADTHFELGKLLESLGDFSSARREFLLARDHDICPLRILSSMERSMEQVAARNNVPLLNAHQLLENQTRHGILDSSMLVDHVHPSFAGHQQVAMALVEQLSLTGLISPHEGWMDRSKKEFQRHFEQLPDIYFAKGEQNLANLRYWTQGMADGPPVESRPPQRAMSGSSGRD